MGFLIRVLVNAFAIYLIARIVPGIEVSSLLTALGAGLVLGLINAIVRPILVVLTLPVTLVTLGLFLLVLNGLCLWLTSLLVTGFEIHGVWAAVWGALLVSVVSWILNAFVSDRGRIVVITGRGRRLHD
ncbi:MAG: phage holin family protein [Candidatus Rokubacteria bacterium]|nr:phage holin family protein [Candidatus Rokubacteria bacterium]